MSNLISRFSQTLKNGLSEQGCQIWAESGSDWHQTGQIRDFLRLKFSTFGSAILISQRLLSRFVPIGLTLGPNKSDTPALYSSSYTLPIPTDLSPTYVMFMFCVIIQECVSVSQLS